MSEKALKKQLSDVLRVVTSNEEVIAEVKKDNKMVIELLETIYQRVEDMSKKFDEVLNAGSKVPKTGAAAKTKASAKAAPKKKKPNTKSDESQESKSSDKAKTTKAKKESAPPPINNIMAYFKHVYADDPSSLDDIMEENQAKGVFKENKEEIEAKKEGAVRDKHKVNLVYKSLTKDQRKKLREKMVEENEANVEDEDEVAEESGSD